jgi:hypothetical protein
MLITYCTNIHPGESWDEVFGNLRTYIPAVKEAVSPYAPFPLGLRLSCRAAAEIDERSSSDFMEWCIRNDCFAATMNGFPYGLFHYAPVKEQVYIPDWRHAERVEYTKRLAELLGEWLPNGIRGSISTVPIGFAPHIGEHDVLEYLDRVNQKKGKKIVLSLEPEPGCVIERSDDIVGFFERMSFPEELMPYVGICLDCCHQAVQFEDPAESLSLISTAGIAIGKVQVSSALRLNRFDPVVVERFEDPVYLHQVAVKRRNGEILRYNDLPDALMNHGKAASDEWRIHFHVPIFIDETPRYGTTRFFIEELIPLLDKDMLLEVETYTWDVLPPELRKESVTESIVRELIWLRSRIDEANGRS